MALKVHYRSAMKDARQQVARIEKAMVNRLQRYGEKFVTNARMGAQIDPGMFPKGDYQDQTTNLRNSIGYVIYKDGQAIDEHLPGGGIGASEAHQVLEAIPKKTGYVLIGIAGMEYASHLETMGYNVITSQKFVLITDLERGMKELERKTAGEIKILSR